jgi:phosphoglycerate kinase
MINLPKLTDLDVVGKRVLLRLDLDTDPDPNDLRIKASEETLNYLKEKGCQILILSHKGRPTHEATAGEAVPSDRESLSLKPFQSIFDKWGAEVKENLRFDPGEENNDPEFAKKLASLGDVYVNEAFASSHRKHASIVGLPKLLPHAAGFRFQKEVENLSKVLNEPKRPVIFLLSGVKDDKLSYLEGIKKIADKILIGGRLPDYMGDEKLVSVRSRGEDEQVIVGNLTMDKEDITLNTIERFGKEIEKAKTIVVSGPLGKYEDEGHRQGTERVLRKVIENRDAFKVAGGGDTEKALNSLTLSQGFDWVSVGGGAMLEFLAKRTLPGIEALI